MFKKIVSSLVIAALLFAGFNVSNASANEKFSKILVDGDVVEFTVQPTVINGETFVQLAPMLKSLKAVYEWTPQNKSLVAWFDNNEITVVMFMDNKVIDVRRGGLNGKWSKITVQNAPRLINGSAMVPISLLKEIFNFEANLYIDTNYNKGIKPPQGKIDTTKYKFVNGWTTFENNYVKFRFTPKSLEYFGYVYNELETIAPKIEEFYGKDTLKGDKVDVWAYDNEGANALLHSSFYNGNLDAIALVMFDNYNDGELFLITHELTHGFQHHKWDKDKMHIATNGITRWIYEGQADYVAKKIIGYVQYEGKEVVGKERDFNFYKKDLHWRNNSKTGWGPIDWDSLNSFAEVSQNYPDDYLAFETMHFFLIEKYGKDKYFKFFDSLGQGKEIKESFKSVFGKSDNELYKEYRKYFDI